MFGGPASLMVRTMEEATLAIGDRVEVLAADYRGEVTNILRTSIGERYEVTADVAHVGRSRDGQPMNWPANWLRKLSVLEVMAEAANGGTIGGPKRTQQ